MVSNKLFKQLRGEVPQVYGVVGISAVVATVAVAGAAASAYSGYKQGKANEKNIEAQNAQAAQNHAIQEGYHDKLKVHQTNLEKYANKQQNFAYEKKEYGELTYRMAQSDRAKQVAYLNEQSYNEKQAAQAQFKADEQVNKIMSYGAKAQANSVTADILRSQGANVRGVNTKAEKMMGTVVATSQSGIAQGKSKDRMLVDAFMQRNEAVAQLQGKAKVGIMAAVNAKDKIVNDGNLRLAESYRGLEAIMKSRPQPVGATPPPTPVFTVQEPLAPLAPVGAAPIQVGTAGNAALIAGAVGTVASGAVNAYSILK